MSFNYIKSMLYDPAQVHYLVDSDFRTVAQGWARPDQTGPLDLYGQRNPGYVYRTGEYSRDQLAIQAGIDALVDFRGDVLFSTPGTYTIGTTALALDANGMRWLGPDVRNPRRAAVTITDAIGDNSISVDDVEIGNLRLVPLTAQNFFTNATGADGGYIHHVHYDSTGVAASTATEFFLTIATTADWLVEQCVFEVDAAQGDAFTFVDARRWHVRDCNFFVNGPTITWASVVTFSGTASLGVIFERCHFGSGGGANGLITNEFTGMAGGSILKVMYCTVDGTSTPTGTNIETGFDATVGIELVENYLTGDATTTGGVLITLA
jgi:hypothetical protein